MIEFRAFEPDDLMALELQPQQAMEMGALPSWRELGHLCHGAGPAWTGLFHGKPIGCAGFAVHFGGRAECWCWRLVASRGCQWQLELDRPRRRRLCLKLNCRP